MWNSSYLYCTLFLGVQFISDQVHSIWQVCIFFEQCAEKSRVSADDVVRIFSKKRTTLCRPFFMYFANVWAKYTSCTPKECTSCHRLRWYRQRSQNMMYLALLDIMYRSSSDIMYRLWRHDVSPSTTLCTCLRQALCIGLRRHSEQGVALQFCGAKPKRQCRFKSYTCLNTLKLKISYEKNSHSRGAVSVARLRGNAWLSTYSECVLKNNKWIVIIR